VAYEHIKRTNGETFVEGAPLSRLQNPSRRLTFVPAGHEYREQYNSHIDTRLTFVYVEPSLLRMASDTAAGHTARSPRLFFEDLVIWHLVTRLKALLDGTSSSDRPYLEAITIVLVHELVRSGSDAPVVQLPPRGGLASWQERIITTYIEENFAQRISLATLARLVRLSRWHFSRAFKQSFGTPPLLYVGERRIEHAKRLLANRELSVLEIALEVGFVSSSAFTTAFRKATGLAPRAYARAL
jgi:AraC family transcriptional regulator